jgi:DNA-directed RNA polymerase specialized sigma24 family protein
MSTKENKLSKRQREAWKLVNHDGLTYSQASDVMDISENTLEKHLEICFRKKRDYQYTLNWMSQGD